MADPVQQQKRAEQRAEALRRNLRRRKAQAKERLAPENPPHTAGQTGKTHEQS